MRGKRFASLLVASLLALALMAPAHAANVTVTLRIAVDHYYNPTNVCTLSVPANSDGVVLLDLAVFNGCIQSYQKTYYPQFGGYFIDCINGICNSSAPPFEFWAMRENLYLAGSPSQICASTEYGVSGYRAAAGEELSFTFEGGGLHPVACLD